MEVKFQKTRPNAIVPSKREGDAGYDLYVAINSDFLDNHCGIVRNGSFLPIHAVGDMMDPNEEIYIAWKGHEVLQIPTGIKTEFDKDYVGIVKERGSTGLKRLAVRSGVIDSSFRGEWFLLIENCADYWTYFPVKKALAQVLFLRVEDAKWIESELQESERGEGALGSSGK